MLIEKHYTIEEVFKIVEQKTGFKLTKAELARRINVSKQYINQIKDEYLPSKFITLLEQNFGIEIVEENNNCIDLDYYPDIYASCGNGCIVFDESKEKLTIAKSTIPYYSPNEKYFVVTCKGSSMSPILEDDDKAIIQQWQGEQIIDDRIYLFSYNSELFIKRLVKNLDQIVVISENKTFENRIVTKKDEFRIIGQIVGMFRDLK
jgi:phage repressor protein C with HTH and peptisase S24 domain